MDKVTIGIPRALHYYYYGTLWTSFLEELGFRVLVSPKTTKDILTSGCNLSNDEMCLSLKIYFGHVYTLESKCDYILVPRIDNYGVTEQTCTNFLGLFNMVQNFITTPLLTYNIDEAHQKHEMNEFIKLGLSLGKGKEQSKLAYIHSFKKWLKENKIRKKEESKKLNSQKIKILLVSHPYNIEDPYIGSEILNLLKNMNVEVIMAEAFISREGNKKALELSPNLYWKYNKELIGTIPLLQKQIDGILYVSSFPCALDSLVNELMLRKIKMPHLNLIVDEESGSAGMETRLESFIDILYEKREKAR